MPTNNITYFTFNDQPGGVYNSQVIEVVNYLNTVDQSTKVKLLAFVSHRNFKASREKIKTLNPKALVLPSIAPLKHWHLNKWLLKFVKWFSPTSKIICRGPLATCLALDTYKTSQIIYDGRGAVVAEQNEYGVYDHSGIEKKLRAIEKKAVLQSHFRIAVTKKLVEYWQKEFDYSSHNHVIVPCTVSEIQPGNKVPDFIHSFLQENQEKTIFTFAGGNGKWQGIDFIFGFLEDQFMKNNSSIGLLLCPENRDLKAFQHKFPNRVLLTTVLPEQVHSTISLCDYGLLLRQSSVTNRVASPVKVAEYLQAGLKVIISPEIGDYSELIVQLDCGFIYKKEDTGNYKKPSIQEKQNSQKVAKLHFTKNSSLITKAYKEIVAW